MNTTLSIVMPVFNHAEELKTMLDSILANTFQDWELLAVDDGSNPDTITLLKEYSAKDGRIKFILRDREPKGAQTCRNIGLELTKGDFIVFFDSDDFVAPYCLEQRVRELLSHPELDFMVFRSGTFVDDTFHTEPNKNNYGYHIYNDDIAAFSARTLPFIVWNNIYRRTSLIEHEIHWDTSLLSLQDAQFNIECLIAGMQYDYSSCPPDYGYRTGNNGSVSKNILSQSHFDSNIYATERFYSLVQSRFMHRYDRQLLRGMLFVYVKVSRTGVKTDFNKELAAVVRRHSPLRGLIFTMKIYLTRVLSIFLPLTTARRTPIIGYLMWYKHWETWVIIKQKDISNR